MWFVAVIVVVTVITTPGLLEFAAFEFVTVMHPVVFNHMVTMKSHKKQNSSLIVMQWKEKTIKNFFNYFILL